MRFNVLPVKSSARTTPISDKGSENITAKGAEKELNCMTKIKYIKAMPEISAMPISVKTSFWSLDAPSKEIPYPSGKLMLLAIFKASAVTSPEERPCALAETPMVRLPSECSILEGALPMDTLAI